MLPDQGLAAKTAWARATNGPLAADFGVYATCGGARYERSRAHVELPEGQEEVRVEYEVDSSHLPTVFTVEIPPEFAGQVRAGWRLPGIEPTCR